MRLTGMHEGAWRQVGMQSERSRSLSVEEKAIHARLSNHATHTHGERMAAQVVRVARVTGVCDDIGFQSGCRASQDMHVWGG